MQRARAFVSLPQTHSLIQSSETHQTLHPTFWDLLFFSASSHITVTICNPRNLFLRFQRRTWSCHRAVTHGSVLIDDELQDALLDAAATL